MLQHIKVKPKKFSLVLLTHDKMWHKRGGVAVVKEDKRPRANSEYKWGECGIEDLA